MGTQMSRKEERMGLLLSIYNAQQLLFNAVSALGTGGAYEQCPACVKFKIGTTEYEVHNEFSSLFLFEKMVRRYYSGRHVPIRRTAVTKVQNKGLRFGEEAQCLYDARLMRRR